MERCVELVGGWKVSYSTTKAIDDYFSEWACLYLKRMQSQDLVGPDDVIGGRPFSRYVSVLEALSARSQKHIAFAAMLRARSRSADMRNLLTTYANRTYFIESVSAYMDAGTREISEIFDSLVLSGENLDVHTSRSEAGWAPVVQASSETFILPVYGLDINPFQFLLTDLRARYESDWFRIANNREARWVRELEKLYAGPRWQRHTGNLKLRLDGKVATDIDFATLDTKTNELAIFQLKWQQPVSLDNRVRRSTGQNLVNESNRWIDVVLSWLTQNGDHELVGRLGFQSPKSPTVHLFVLGRYHAHISGFDNHDQQAMWCSLAHFKRMRTEGPRRSVSQLAGDLRSSIHRLRSSKKGESSMLLVGELPVLINPTSTPPAPLAKPAPQIRHRSSRCTSLPSIQSDAQASARWVRSIQPCPTGERAMRSPRRVSAIPASKAGRIRAVMLILEISKADGIKSGPETNPRGYHRPPMTRKGPAPRRKILFRVLPSRKIRRYIVPSHRPVARRMRRYNSSHPGPTAA